MKLFGFALTSAQYVTTLQALNESLSVDNQNLAGQLNAVKAELAREQSAHNRALAAFNDMKASEDKFKGEVAILEHELQELRDQKAEIEQERMEAQKTLDEVVEDNGTLLEDIVQLKKKYEEVVTDRDDLKKVLESHDHTIEELWAKWHEEAYEAEIKPLQTRVAQLNGRLGAYKKKFGELPHKREEQRKRKAQKQNQPSEEKLEKTTY